MAALGAEIIHGELSIADRLSAQQFVSVICRLFVSELEMCEPCTSHRTTIIKVMIAVMIRMFLTLGIYTTEGSFKKINKINQ